MTCANLLKVVWHLPYFQSKIRLPAGPNWLLRYHMDLQLVWYEADIWHHVYERVSF